MHRMLPLMKTCVTLDPGFVDAYLLGAWHMAYNATASMPESIGNSAITTPRMNTGSATRNGITSTASTF